MCQSQDFIEPYNGEIGDVLVLTKPLGTQIAVNVHEWRVMKDRKYNILRQNNIINDTIESLSFNISTGSMIRLNKIGAMLMHKYGAHGATDITGFGPKGHINNLAMNQTKMQENGVKYEFYVHTLPIIYGMPKVAKFMKDNKMLDFKLIEGYSAETSGGLLIMLPRRNANAFIEEIQRLDNWPAFVVGEIREKKEVYDYNKENELVVFEDENNMNIIEVGKNISLKSNL